MSILDKNLGTNQESHQDVLVDVGTAKFGDESFIVVKDEWRDGRKHLYFAETRDALAKADKKSRDVARIGYRIFGDEVVLLGLVVPSAYAGKNMGKDMIDYFVQEVEKQGLKFMGTGQINKPMIAQTLVRAGFQPISKNVLVEILPRSTSDDSRVPNVQLLQNRQGAKLKTSAVGGDFYRIIPPEEVEKKYPLTTEENVVAIQTRYVRKQLSE